MTLEGITPEIQALLHTHLPAALGELENHILETCRFFDLKIPGMIHSDLMVRQIPVYMQTEHKPSHSLLKFDGTIFGSEIVDAKITVQLPRAGKSATLATYHPSVTPDHPWSLQQLQDAGNYVALALGILRSRDRCAANSIQINTSKSGFPCAAKLLPIFSSLSDASTFLNKILQLLMRGLNTLCNPPNLLLTSTGIISMKQAVFSPPLPDDICLSMHMQTEKLVITLYQIPQGVMASTMNNQLRKQTAAVQAIPLSVPIVPILRLHADTTISQYEQLLEAYRRSVAACHSLVDKITILSQYTDGMGDISTPSFLVH